jgi:hypothetical protein
MAEKKQLFTEMELAWAEEQLSTWKKYISDRPIDSLTDRLSYKTTSNGGSVPMVVASIEQQGKFIQDTMKNYLALVKEVDAMRAIEESKKIARGSSVVPHRMQ